MTITTHPPLLPPPSPPSSLVSSPQKFVESYYSGALSWTPHNAALLNGFVDRNRAYDMR